MFIYLLMKWFSIGVVCACYATSILGNNYNKSQFQSIFLINNEITECLIEVLAGCFIRAFLLFNSRVHCWVGSSEQLCSSIISNLTSWARCWWWWWWCCHLLSSLSASCCARWIIFSSSKAPCSTLHNWKAGGDVGVRDHLPCGGAAGLRFMPLFWCCLSLLDRTWSEDASGLCVLCLKMIKDELFFLKLCRVQSFMLQVWSWWKDCGVWLIGPRWLNAFCH